jgi:hypothetical protein
VPAIRTGLHRADRNAELLGDFTVRVPLKVLHSDDLTFVWIKAVDRGSHAPHGLDLFGTWRQHYERTVRRVGMVKRLGRAPLLYAERIDGRAASNHGQPWRKIPTCIEVTGKTPGLDKHVLRDVFYALPIAYYPMGNGEHQPTEPLVQRAHCI